ncbi:MAG: flagellar biosynthetic protein FliO [Betaproteobacteria bacterium]
MTRNDRFPRYFTYGLGSLWLLVWSPCSWAQASAAEAPGVSNVAILQMLFGLALIIAILFSGAYVLRRLNGGARFGNTGPMKVVGGLMLSARERIILVEVDDTWLVIGIVPGQIKTLHSQPKGELPSPAHTNKPFGHWLKTITERNNEKS